MQANLKVILLFSFLLSLSTIVSLGYCDDPKKELYVLGGGGEPVGEKTIFDESLKKLSAFSNPSDWNTTVNFNGGHAETEEIIATQMDKAKNAGPFVKEKYEDLVKEMIRKIKSGEVKAGDQMMVTLDTHGGKKLDYKTHYVALSFGAVTDLNTLAGSSIVSLDPLEELVEVASAKGVKLAILDMSCFSGNLLNIKNDKVCLISASGVDEYSYTGLNNFSAKFYELMKKGKNLEDIFLEARQVGVGADFPMISTPEGRLINDSLYQLISPFLTYNSNAGFNFTTQYPANNIVNFDKQVCSLNGKSEQLKDLLKQYESLTKVIDAAVIPEAILLRGYLDEYREHQKQYEKAAKDMFSVEEEAKNIFNNLYPDEKSIWSKYQLRDLLATKPKDEHIKTMTENVQRALSADSNQKLKHYRQALLKTSVTLRLATQISKGTKKVYDILYKQMREKNSNPCRDFIL